MLKKIILNAIALLFVFTNQLLGKEISGVVKSGTKSLSEVVVTDGTNFAITDKSGKYTLNTSKKAEYVYIFTPSGYSAPFTSGTPQFYQLLENDKSNYVFDLLPLPNQSDDYVLLATADPQTGNKKQFERFEKESVADLRKVASDYKSQHRNVVGIALGDIVWDSLDMFGDFKRAISSLDIPFYPVIGNHDYDLKISDMNKSAEAYKNAFGPIYYGFNLGPNYYIVLDDILYKGNKSYDEDVNQEQLDWLKKYLRFVPKGSKITIGMHAPFKNLQSNRIIPHGKELLDICKNYKLSFISGHTHLNSNMDVAPDVVEHNIGALCGTWWTAETCKDGTPNGYQIFENKGNSLSWHYKSVGKNYDYQMELFGKGEFPEHANEVVAKIWNWDPEWKVEWFEDGKNRGEMKQFSSYAPDYLKFILQHDKDKGIPEYKQPIKSFFYFSAFPSFKAKQVEVVATDRFGKKYSQTIALHSMDVEAHRGGAGLMPENTIPAMENAAKLGANTLELDLHITKDGKVMVAHDAHINPGFTLNPNGAEISDSLAQQLYFYKMPYSEIRRYETGSKPYPKFPGQMKMITHIPLVADLIDSVEQFTAQNHLSPMFYNIEIKSNEGLEKKGLIPDFKSFTDQVMKILLQKDLGDRLMIQCFDVRTLNYMHHTYPTIRLAYLVSNQDGFENNMKKLDFVPEVYSPNANLVDSALVDNCHSSGMKIVPWTVDEDADVKKLLSLHVDGLIGNYPDVLLKNVR